MMNGRYGEIRQIQFLITLIILIKCTLWQSYNCLSVQNLSELLMMHSQTRYANKSYKRLDNTINAIGQDLALLSYNHNKKDSPIHDVSLHFITHFSRIIPLATREWLITDLRRDAHLEESKFIQIKTLL